MRPALLEWRRESVEAASKLDEAAGGDPAGELPLESGRLNVPRQQQAGLEDGLFLDDAEQVFEFHGANLPEMASCCNGIP